ncbi:MAG: hypothetical protein PHY94_07650, partial [Candidatus Omnitrophica bacterium]|nr:hypothetical protein [Candidatus Omnitrophota bacterium]
MNKINRVVFLILGIFFLFTFCAYTQDVDIKYNSDKGIFTMPFGRAYDYSNIIVKRAVDGDTLVLENGERVRLIGIDTPELHES